MPRKIVDKNTAQDRLQRRRIGLGINGFLLAVLAGAVFIMGLLDQPPPRSELQEIRGVVERDYIDHFRTVRTHHVVLRTGNSQKHIWQNDGLLTSCAGGELALATGDSLRVLTQLQTGFGKEGLEPYEKIWELERNGKIFLTYDQMAACQQKDAGGLEHLAEVLGIISAALFGGLYISGRRGMARA